MTMRWLGNEEVDEVPSSLAGGIVPAEAAVFPAGAQP